MPRDLSALKEDNASSALQLTRSPDEVDAHDDGASTKSASQPPAKGQMFSEMMQQADRRDELHPYVQTLTLDDIDSCVRIEEAAFPPHERATREKFDYRLRTCGQLCMGIYTSAEVEQNDAATLPTIETSAPVYTGAPARKAALLGHILATKSVHDTVTDADMEIPSDGNAASGRKVGHREEGQTICIHSLAVLPAYRGRGLGKTLVTAYLQRMQGQQVAERVALLAHDDLIAFYQSLGFESRGKSEASFGGGGWTDMVIELSEENESAEALGFVG